MYQLADSPTAFLGHRPEWTLAGATLAASNGSEVRLVQPPFQWNHGVWEADTLIFPTGGETTGPQRVMMRISPDTLRRWKEVAINPFLEACAQLKEHLHRKTTGELSVLTLL